MLCGHPSSALGTGSSPNEKHIWRGVKAGEIGSMRLLRFRVFILEGHICPFRDKLLRERGEKIG